MAETESGYSYPMMYYQNNEYIALKEDDISQIRSSLDKLSNKVEAIKTIFQQYDSLQELDPIYVDKIKLIMSWCDKTKNKIQIVSNNLYGFMSGMGDTEESVLSKIESGLSQYAYMTPTRPGYLKWAVPNSVETRASAEQYVVDNSQKSVKKDNNTEIKVEEQQSEITAAPTLENMSDEKDTEIEEAKIDSSIEEMQKLENILHEVKDEKEQQKIISLDESFFKGSPFRSNTDPIVANPITTKQSEEVENETVGRSILGSSVDTSSTKSSSNNSSNIFNSNIFNGNDFFSNTSGAQESVRAASESSSEEKETSSSSMFSGNDFFSSTSSAKESAPVASSGSNITGGTSNLFNAQSKLEEILRRKGNGV